MAKSKSAGSIIMGTGGHNNGRVAITLECPRLYDRAFNEYLKDDEVL